MTPTEVARIVQEWPDFEWRAGMDVSNGHDSGVVTSVWYSEWDNDGNGTAAPTSVFVQFDEDLPAIDIARPGSGTWWPILTDDATWGACLSLVEDVLGEPVNISWDVISTGSFCFMSWGDCEVMGKDGDHRHARAAALARLIQTMGGEK